MSEPDFSNCENCVSYKKPTKSNENWTQIPCKKPPVSVIVEGDSINCEMREEKK